MTETKISCERKIRERSRECFGNSSFPHLLMRVSLQSNCLRMQDSLSIHLPVTSARRENKEEKRWTGPLLGKGGSTYEFMNSLHGVRTALLTFGCVKYLPNSYSCGHKRDDNYANDWRRPTPTRQLHFHNDALTYRTPEGRRGIPRSLSPAPSSSGLRLLMTRRHRLKAHFLTFKKKHWLLPLEGKVLLGFF